MIRSHFQRSPYVVNYALFKTFCMPLYGCQVLDLDGRSIERLHVTWRKCIRNVLSLPYRTHSSLLHHICGDDPFLVQLCKRFIKFFRGAFISKNVIVSMCAQLALRGSGSHVSNSLNYVAHFYNINKCDIVESSLNSQTLENDENDVRTANFIQEVLEERWFTMMHPFERTLLNLEETNELLFVLCTS